MDADLLTLSYYVMWGLLVFTAIFFFVSGIDDLFFDIFYWVYMSWRYRYVKHRPKLTYEKLAEKKQQRIAVMIPCWHEAGVIEEMLRYNSYAIDYDNYNLFVGVYPNDPNTVAAVQSMSAIFPHVICVVGEHPGPTNKASNLNAIYEYILEHEKRHGIQYDIFVMHDSEDIIHNYSFMLYNYLMPKNNMIQVPIFPLEVPLYYFTHWTYNAEFCELHTKDIVVREKIGGLVPSAGVGTAFSRDTIELLKELRGGIPFSTYSLTEDYSTALQIKLQGLRQIFVLQHLYRTAWRKKWFLFGRLVPYHIKEYIATRAIFPDSYFKAVRQKTRWILGITFQEWIHTGWQGNLATEYTLMHDRKSIFTHLVNGLFFIQAPFWFCYIYFTANMPDYPTLQDSLDLHPWVFGLIAFASSLMLNRFLQRGIAVFRLYGIIPALISLPLILYGNIINMHALLRAYYQFIFSPKAKNAVVKWDKTDHTFPKHDMLAFHKIKLGDLLLENKLVKKDQLVHALSEQAQTGEQLGFTLLRLNYINEKQLRELLAKQYHMRLISKAESTPLPFEKIPHISKFTYDRLLHNECYPISIENDELTLAIDDPSNENKLSKIQYWIKPYQAKFCLIGLN